MKRQVSILVVLATFLFIFGGCDQTSKTTETIPEGTIPLFATGTWQQRDGVFKIVIEPNGVVSSIIIPVGTAEVRPNQTTEMEMKDGSISTFTGGDFFADCNPITRELTVVVETREFHVRFLDNRLDGNRVDSLSGSVSDDGKVWEPNWIEIFDYGPGFPQDENDILYPQPLVFDKITPQQ